MTVPSSSPEPLSPFDRAVDESWLAQHREEPLEPERPIIDAHHHLWLRGAHRYLLEEYCDDIDSGHNIVATVFVQCGAMYRSDGPMELRSLGETEFANGIAAMSASGLFGATRVCAGIVGAVDLRVGKRAGDVLTAHMQTAGGRFKGIRQSTTWDDDSFLMPAGHDLTRGMLGNPAFREGFACLAALGLSFDAWLYFHQIDELTALAQSSPEVRIILNHVGGPVGLGRHAGRGDANFFAWKRSIASLARCDNVYVKLGGPAARFGAITFGDRTKPPSSIEVAQQWEPYVVQCIESFGARRCMFESNFPPDKRTYGYDVIWNAFKRLAAGASEAEKASLFHDTAARVYRL